MRDEWYNTLVEESDSTSGVDISWFIDSDAAKTGTVKFGSLFIGKHKIFKDLQYVVFDYESNKNNVKIISTPTKQNIESLKKVHKSEVVVDKIIKVNIATKRQVLSTIVTGTIGGEEFVWSRVETNSASAGQTYIYFKDADKMMGKRYMIKLKTTIKELSDGTYKIDEPSNRVITYCRNYGEIKVGPELKIYAAKDIHRDNFKPAVIYYNESSISGGKRIRLMEYWEDGRHRFSVASSTYSGDDLTLIFANPHNYINVKADKGKIQTFIDDITKNEI